MRLATAELGGGVGVQRKRPPAPKRKIKEYRKWATVNLTDARTDLEDQELFWLENGIPIGKGSIQWLPGPGAPIATLAQGIATQWGFTLNGTPIVIAVGQDGSLTQVTVPGGVKTVISGAGAVSTLAHLAIWQGTTILIIDPTTGYSSWNGTVYVVIDATRVGESIASFEGRVWIGHNRTITFSAPNTFNDFTVANGAGTTVITDEQFIGNIVALLSGLEQLWIFGAASINALSNVTATGSPPSVVTTFSITNIILGIGSAAPNSIMGYLRAIAFMSAGGEYAISGVTPQQLSEKIDGIFPALNLTGDVPGAIAIIRNLYCLCFLVSYTQANAPELPTPANGLSTATPIILCFTKGKQFFASQGATLKWITTVIVGSTSQAWGADGAGNIFQLFGGKSTDNNSYKAVGRLDPLDGNSMSMKALIKVGVELQSPNPITPTLTIDSDLGSQAIPVAGSASLRLLNNLGQPLQLLNSSGQPLLLLTQGQALYKTSAAMFGHYLGWTYQVTAPPHRLQAVQFSYVVTREEDPTGAGPL